jgi:hypothetical protein
LLPGEEDHFYPWRPAVKLVHRQETPKKPFVKPVLREEASLAAVTLQSPGQSF